MLPSSAACSVPTPCTSSPPCAPARLGRSSSVSTTRCAGRKGPLDCTGRMGCRPLLLDLALLLDHVAPGSDGMDECSFIHGASADHSFFERGIWASILGLAPDFVSEGGVLIRYLSIL